MNSALLTFKENIVLLLTSFRFIKSRTVLENYDSYIQSYILDSRMSTTTKTKFDFKILLSEVLRRHVYHKASFTLCERRT